jgi:tetratricopeptide (TPR) repeat protein
MMSDAIHNATARSGDTPVVPTTHGRPLPVIGDPDGLGSEAIAEAMVLGAISPGIDPCGFACRRAWHEAERVQEPGRRRHLLKVLRTCTDPGQDGDARTGCLLEWAGYHEGRCRFDEAAAILDRAVEERPTEMEPILGRARVARKGGDVERARSLYRRVRELAEGDEVLGELAAVGEAMVAADPEAALTRALGRLRSLPVPEATAVAHEARAQVRRREGRIGPALRDYLAAAVRFTDPMDRGRLGQEMADVLIGAGDPLAAREVLLQTLEYAHPRQLAGVQTRLRVLARSMGDDVGVRRWADAPKPEFVTLGLSRRQAPGGAPAPTRVGRMSRWLDRLGALRPD